MSSVAANSLDPASAVLLEIRGVAKRFGAREVLRNISLNIAEGEFLALL
ncbi:MAG: putative 2-aminoethylphosphonate ABC transporter ATP-binding protein, partial [Acidobacteria bacterium]